MNFIINEQHYKDIYNYLNALILPKTDDELRKLKLSHNPKIILFNHINYFDARKMDNPKE